MDVHEALKEIEDAERDRDFMIEIVDQYTRNLNYYRDIIGAGVWERFQEDYMAYFRTFYNGGPILSDALEDGYNHWPPHLQDAFDKIVREWNRVKTWEERVKDAKKRLDQLQQVVDTLSLQLIRP